MDKTFGYRRFEIIAAFINGAALILIAIFIFYEAIQRFVEPPNVNGGMMIIAVIGLIINIVVAWLLMRGDSKENLNLRSALLHVIGDLLGSIGAIVAGALILLFGWNIADPIASVIVAILIIISGFRITKDSMNILMEGKPEDINVTAIKESLSKMDGIEDVHDLHVWSITSEFPTLSCHLIVKKSIDRDLLLQRANEMIHHHFNISHCTIQIEGINSTIHKNCNSCD